MCKVYFWNVRAGEGDMEYLGTFSNVLVALSELGKIGSATGNVERDGRLVAAMNNGEITLYTR